MKIRLSFAAWNPGEHGPDLFLPRDSSSQTYDRRAEETFRRHNEGWADVWNMVDAARRGLEGVGALGGLRLMTEDGVSFGPYLEDEDVVNYYPFWYAWMLFSVEYGIIRVPITPGETGFQIEGGLGK